MAKSLEVMMAEGRSHLTKAQIERKANKVQVGTTGKLICPDYVLSDTIAHRKWVEITRIYRSSSYGISNSDSGHLARYCRCHAEYITLLSKRDEIVKQDDISQIILIDRAINQKISTLNSLEDRLFLNPLSKVKNVPKAQKIEKSTDSDLFE